jgi:glycosyltransferase involved in cell wall biosynthesis
MRICFVTSEFPPHPGGIARSASRIVTTLAGAEFDIHVFVPINGGTPLVEKRPSGITFYRVPYSGDLLFALTTAIQSFLSYYDSQLNFDLFHGFELHMAYPVLKIARSRPVIASLRGIDAIWMSERPAYARIAADVLRYSSWVTAVSTTALGNAQRIADISLKSSFIPNSIDSSRFFNWSLQGCHKGRVGTVSTFRPKKQLPLLVRGYAALAKDLRSHLLLVGGTRRPENIQPTLGEIRNQGILDEVTITGLVDRPQVMRYLLEMNLFAIYSANEGLPNSILEAAASGVPIVASAVDGIKDVFEDGVNALLVSPEKLNELVDAMTIILKDSTTAESLGRGAAALARRLTPDSEKSAWRRLYLELAKQYASTTPPVDLNTSVS